MSQYRSGLNDTIIKQREENRMQILSRLDAEKDNWDDWHWQLRNIARDEKKLSQFAELSDKEIENIQEVNRLGIPLE